MPEGGLRSLNKVSFDIPADQQEGIHNRWHYAIPSAGTIKQGESTKIECLDWTGGQIKNDDSADDVLNANLTKCHYLSGPFDIEGAEPGDVIELVIQDVQPFQDRLWGYTGVFHKNNGGGFLDRHYPEAAKAIWDFEGVECTSRHVPGVRFPGLIHPGIIGCAPSKELLAEWNRREGELIAENTDQEQIVALPPEPNNAYAGPKASKEVSDLVAKEGARTIPPRDHGGNMDIKNLSRGSKLFLPVYVTGGKLSVGDLHFSQGDGEISFCGAIEMAGQITIKCQVIKNGVKDLVMKTPMHIPGAVQPHYADNRHLYFEGISVDEYGKQKFLCATTAYRQCCLQVIEYLKRYGYNEYQIYLLLSCAPIQGHIASIVDVPNAACTLGLPVDIFDFDVMPSAGPVKKRDLGNCAFASK